MALGSKWMFSFALSSHCRSTGDTEVSHVYPGRKCWGRSNACRKQISLVRASGERKANLANLTELQQWNITANPCCWTTIPTTSHAPGGVSVWVGMRENRSLSESTPGLQIKTFFSLGGDSSSKLRCKPESHCYSSQHTELNQIPMCQTETRIPAAELGPISNCNIISNKLSKEKWGGITHLTPCT